MKTTCVLILLLIVLLLSPSTWAARIELMNGDVLEGEIVSETDTEITVQMDYGTMVFERGMIKSISPSPTLIETPPTPQSTKSSQLIVPLTKAPPSRKESGDSHKIEEVKVDSELSYFVRFFGTKEQFNAAFKKFQSVVAENPHDFASRYQLGLCYFYLQQYKKAAVELSLVLENNPHDLEAQRFLSYAYYKLGNLKQAIALAQERLAIVPFDMKTRRLLAEAYYQMNNISAAKKEYEQILTATPHDKRILLQLAQIYDQEGKQGKAREYRAQAESIAIPLSDT